MVGLEVAQEAASAHEFDLVAVVVDVEFAEDLVACGIQKVAAAVAEGRGACGDDVEGAGGIGGNVFEDDLAGVLALAATVAFGSPAGGADVFVKEMRRKEDVEESGAGDFNFFEVCGVFLVLGEGVKKGLGEVAGLGVSEGLAPAFVHGDGAGEVAEFFVACVFDAYGKGFVEFSHAAQGLADFFEYAFFKSHVSVSECQGLVFGPFASGKGFVGVGGEPVAGILVNAAAFGGSLGAFAFDEPALGVVFVVNPT